MAGDLTAKLFYGVLVENVANPNLNSFPHRSPELSAVLRHSNQEAFHVLLHLRGNAFPEPSEALLYADPSVLTNSESDLDEQCLKVSQIMLQLQHLLWRFSEISL